MTRQNFWDVIQETEINPINEVRKIESVFSSNKFNVGGLWQVSIEEHINKEYFLSWTHRGTCFSTQEFRSQKGILNFQQIKQIDNITKDEMFLYFEFIINMIFLVKQFSVDTKKAIMVIIQNMKNILEQYNCEFKKLEGDIHVIVEKSEKVTAASELYPEIAPKVIEYNRFAIKGNLQKKREIILAIADKFEGIQKKLKTHDKPFVDDATCLLNNAHLRHNNREGHKAKQAIIEMTNDELEIWYDKTYDTLLLALLYADYVDSKKDIDELKKVLK